MRSSSNYELTTDVVDQGGGEATSANYTIQPASTGQSTPIGSSGSSGYEMDAGYVFAADSTPEAAADYYVNCNTGSNANDGLTPENAWKTITFAATMAASGKTVSVAAGIYNTGTGESFPITITGRKFVSSSALLATIEAGSTNALTLGAGATLEGFSVRSTTTDKVINVNGANAYVLNNNLTTSYLVTSGYDIYAETTGDYATVQGNYIDSKRSYSVYFIGSGGSVADYPAVMDNVIINSNTNVQGAIRINWTSTYASIEGNTITSDKGIHLGGTCGDINIRSNKLTAYSSGSSTYYGIFLNGGTGTVAFNEIRGYESASNGGIYVFAGGPITVTNNTLVRNVCGVRVGSGTVTVKNNIISAAPSLGSYHVSNTGVIGSYYVHSCGIYSGGTVSSNNNQLFNNEENYLGAISDKAGDLTTCPRFVNAPAHDYRLYSDSPCVDSDEDGNNRGAYEDVVATSGILTNSYVKAGGAGAQTGVDEDNAWPTITWGLSSTEGTINVLAGTYDTGNGESFTLTLSSDQYLRSIASPTLTATIDAGSAVALMLGRDTTLEGFSVHSTSGDRVINVEGPRAQILNNDLTTSSVVHAGADIYATGYGDYLLAHNNNISSDRLQNIFIYSASGIQADYPTITSNTLKNTYSSQTGIKINSNCLGVTIEGNSVTADKGIDIGGGSTSFVVHNNVIVGYNQSSQSTIGIWSQGTGSIISNEVRGYRSADLNNWGAIRVFSGTVTIKNNTLVRNIIGINNSGTAAVSNNIISSGPQLGTFEPGSVAIRSANSTTTRYNDLFNNNTTYTGSGFNSANDITTSPRFVNAPLHDYRLFADSPCAAGATSSEVIGKYDAIGSTSGILTNSYVKAGGAGAQTGVDEDNAWPTITWGLSSTEGTINVLSGTYNSGLGEIFTLMPSPGQYLKSIASPTLSATIDAGSAVALTLSPNSTLEGFSVRSTTTDKVINIAGANVQVLNNDLTTSYAVLSGYDIYILDAGDYALFQGNRIDSKRTNKLRFDPNADYLTVRDNVLVNVSPYQAAVYVTSGTNRVTVEGNTITADEGISLNGSCASFNIRNNQIVAFSTNTNAKCGMYLYGMGTVASNEVRGYINDGHGGIHLYNTGTATIENNTLVRNYRGVRISAGTATIKNNIISASPTLGSYYANSRGIYRSGGTASSSYNQLFSNADNYYGTVGDKTADQTTYPRFVAAASHDYRLFSDSPCVGTADDGGNRGAYGLVEAASGIIAESYVSETGSDEAGDGSFGDPWRTVTYALSQTEQTVNLRQGAYTTGETFPLTIGPGQRIRNYLTEAATIDSVAVNQHTLQFAPGTTLEGVTINNASAGNHTLYVDAPDVSVLNCTVKQIGSNAQSRAVYVTDLADRCILDGNTISTTASNYYTLQIDNNADNLVITDNTITGPSTSSMVLYFAGASASPTIEGNTITGGNTGMYQNGVVANQLTRRNKFIGVGASASTGISISGASTGLIASNEVRGWNAYDSSKGVYLGYGSSNLTFRNNTIVKCRNGFFTYTGTALIENCIIAARVGGYNGASTKGIDHNGGTITSRYNDLYSNETTYEGTVLDQTGDIQLDPLFLDATNNDYHITAGSPCDGTGTPEGTDMGAYQYDGPPPVTITVTLDTPNGGEIWQGNNWHNITWESTGTPDSFRLYYITSEAAGYQTITTEAAGTAYAWLVPSLNTTTAKVSIEAIKGSEIVTDESNAVFAIDSDPPTAPVLVTPTNGSYTFDTTPLMTWEVSTDILSGVASYEITLDATLITQGATASYTPLAPLSLGIHTWEVRAKDGADNWGAKSSAFTYKLIDATTVINCLDSGPGSLRQCLTDAGPGDTIAFDISLANAGYSTGESYPGLVTNEGTSNTWFRIIVNSNLPNITGNNIQIKGLTQTQDVTNPMPIEIRKGVSSTANIGIDVLANYCTIEGLAINGFSVGGNAAIRITARNNNQILNNYIGTTATGEAAIGNYHGVYISGGSTYNLIKGNLIAGNNKGGFSTGVCLIGSSNNNLVQNNYIGVKKSGTAALANNYGIWISGSNLNSIGGMTEAERNLISGNTYGIYLSDSAASNEVKGNYIGTDLTGASPVPNSYGAYIESSSHHNIIGGSNLIARNTNAGVKVLSTAVYNTITMNTMEANGGKGILLEAGANEDVPYPVISSATIVAGTTTIAGTAQILSSVEVFKTEATPDTSGQGEGKTYLGTAACPAGTWMLTVEGLAIGNKVTATTTTSNDSTSEFAVNATVAEPPPPNTVVNCLDSGPGSLRQCMTDAVFGDTIAFNIPTSDPSYEAIAGGHVWVIRLKSVLPALDDGGVYLNGTTQTINQGDQNPFGPEVMVSVEATAFVNVLSNNNTIEGLTINYFPSGLYAITIYNSYNTIRGCYLGTDAIGEVDATNANRAIWISGSNNLIGGDTAGARNLISGNNSGVFLFNGGGSCTGNRIQGNYIGVNRTATVSIANAYGVYLNGSNVFGNTIGGTNEAERNVISGNSSTGVFITGASTNEVIGNYIGVGADGATDLGNANHGIYLDTSATSVEVRNNLISGNNAGGILVGGSYCLIKGNKIGVAENGVTQVANGGGIVLQTGSDNTVGGSLESERNIISGNSSYGIYITGSLRNTIKGNYIGLALDGTARGNTGNGILMPSGDLTGNVIGGDTTFEGNYIGCNGANGIECNMAAPVLIKNNIIGLAPDGVSSRNNTENGIYLYSSNSNTIESNVISGHVGADRAGIYLSAANSNTIIGNKIGTNRMGTGIVGNNSGIYLNSANYNTIGGSSEAARNLISGNSAGINLAISSNCSVLGNYIGTDLSGENPLANAFGIKIEGAANSNNLIGGDTAAEGNVISGNSSYGIYILNCGSGNLIEHNQVRTNSGPGIYAAGLPGNYQLVIRNCTIEGNTAYGIRNDTAFTIDAQYNNWRTPMGPYDPENNLAVGRWFNPFAEGQPVTDYVDYRYWWGWGTVAPAAPDPFGGTAASSTSINWNWTDNTTREALYYVVDAASKDIKVTSVAGATATTESGLLPYTEYTRSAVAWKMDASSESTSFTVRTLPTEGKPTVEVTYPNGGEKLKGGAVCNITFEAISDIGVKANSVSFWYTTGESWVLINTGQSTEAAYAWTLPVISTTEAMVRVTVLDAADRIGTGESDAFFSIDSTAPTVGITYPNGGETLRANRTYNITFNCSDLSGVKPNSADIYYTTGEGWVPIATGQPTNAACSWVTPLISTTEAKVRINVLDIFDQMGTGESASYFTIDITPSVEVTYPNGGQYFKGGALYNISFTATSEAGIKPNSANIYYTTGEGWVTIASGQATDAVFPWTTPLISTTEAKVRVTALDLSDRVGTDESDGYFAIDSTPPVVGVLSPNGGERWAGGSSQNITWTATDNIGLKAAPITIKYSVNNGAAYDSIAAAQNNSGVYPWTVPAANTSEAKVSVTAEDLAGNITTDESNTAFIIDSNSPFVVSISPTNGATAVIISTEVVAVFSKEMSREAVQGAFDLSASPGVAGVFDWNAGGTIMTFRPSANLEYNKLYNVNIAQTATDLVGNQLAAVFSSSFTTVSQGDDESPHCVIQVVDRDRVASTLKRGDYISKRPWIRGVITDNLALDSSSVKLYLNDVLLAPVLNIISPQRIEANYQFTTDLEDETLKSHTFKLEAKDGAGNAGVKQISDLKVSSGTVRIIGPVLSYPQTFKPKSGTPAKLAYNLTADADIMIYLFSTSGENVWSAKCLTGGAGGRAGYNEVPFDGRSQINSSYLGNGIYVYKITSNNRVIGTGYITIFD